MSGLRFSDRALLAVTGPDAESLLQGVITPDLPSLPAGEARPGALLTPQGKILFDFLISRTGPHGFHLETARENAAGLLKRLTLYKLRAKVEIAEVEDIAIAVVWGEAPENGIHDTRFSETPVYRVYEENPPETQKADPGEYAALRIRDGVAESGSDFALSDAFPHDVLMDLNGGVSFRKGCFVGQEVVSRMQHRGTARRRIAILDGDAPLVTGHALEATGRSVGTLGTCEGTQALALVRADRVREAVAAGEVLTVDGVPVRVRFPAWSGLTLEASADARPA
ncbi:CAF17-like 4Fe-4S cluster assembly/insertion protein YgfZ [Pararhizobium mangrovi]|uniref:Folate-binding protein YgfZ n=1 Tax=Pararhizobium mangrovi TaxID=2590452 RepID=A0A506UDI9_9HYPH|nr:folate-binding protein YgfZ [Pararhizobium mangrovi]TPW32010.1 folate-binding protein YgfZ [Pararhizobium mangrovi]